MDDPAVISHFRHKFAEERVISVSNFHVLPDDVLNVRTSYIKLTLASRVEHLTKCTSLSGETLHTHCFDLVTISEVTLGLGRNRGLVCGYNKDPLICEK